MEINRRLIDETGHRYGDWTVISRLENHGAALWLCRCVCGVERPVLGKALRTGTSKSCGCGGQSGVSKIVIDESGKRYGRWTVVERAGNHETGRALWLCRCDCGTERAVTGNELRSGKSTSCGCARQITQLAVRGAKFFGKDETGKTFGRWTVLRRDTESKGTVARWICRCECGVERSVRGIALRSGESESCGCLRRERLFAANSRPPGEASFSELVSVYRNGARIRNLEFNLTEDQCRALFIQDCFYCGVAPSQVHRPGRTKGNGKFIHNGIDRMDNDLGYTVANAVSCCKGCNTAKMKSSAADFIDLCRRIAARHPLQVQTAVN